MQSSSNSWQSLSTRNFSQVGDEKVLLMFRTDDLNIFDSINHLYRTWWALLCLSLTKCNAGIYWNCADPFQTQEQFLPDYFTVSEEVPALETGLWTRPRPGQCLWALCRPGTLGDPCGNTRFQGCQWPSTGNTSTHCHGPLSYSKMVHPASVYPSAEWG